MSRRDVPNRIFNPLQTRVPHVSILRRGKPRRSSPNVDFPPPISSPPVGPPENPPPGCPYSMSISSPHKIHPSPSSHCRCFSAAFADYFRNLPTLISVSRQRIREHLITYPRANMTPGKEHKSAPKKCKPPKLPAKSLFLASLILNLFVFNGHLKVPLHQPFSNQDLSQNGGEGVAPRYGPPTNRSSFVGRRSFF